jgi:hypothetical protein
VPAIPCRADIAGGAVLADAHVAGGDADDAPAVFLQHLGGGEAGIDFDAQRLGLGRPASGQTLPSETM